MVEWAHRNLTVPTNCEYTMKLNMAEIVSSYPVAHRGVGLQATALPIFFEVLIYKKIISLYWIYQIIRALGMT